MYRQGDVLLKAASLPKGAKRLSHLTLAEGEVTGHKHEIKLRGNTEDAILYEYKGVLYVSVLTEIVPLVHPQHRTIHIPAGTWEIVPQREYVPEGWREVVD